MSRKPEVKNTKLHDLQIRIQTLEKQLAQANTIIQALTADRPETRAELERLSAQVQQAQVKSQQRANELTAVVEVIADPVIILDRNGVFQRANTRAIEAFGFDPVGLDWGATAQKLQLRYLDGGSVPMNELPSRRALRGEQVTGERYLFTNNVGRECTILTSVSPIFENGELIGAVAVWHDVTEREQLLADNRRQKEILRMVFDTDPGPLAVATGGPDFVCRMANPAYRAITPHPEIDPEGCLLRETWPPDEGFPPAYPTLEKVIYTGQSIRLDGYRQVFPDGSTHYFSYHIHPIQWEDQPGVLMVLWEITELENARQRLEAELVERKRVEAALYDRNQRLALLSDAAAELLRGSAPHLLLEHLFQRLSTLLGLEIYAYYSLSANEAQLELAALGSVQENHLESLKQQEFGQAICGMVAQTRQPMVAEDIQHSSDQHVAHIGSLGISAYACYPLISRGRLFGTLAFGTRRSTHFAADFLDLIQAVCHLVATAIERRQVETNLQAYAGQLERSNRDLQEFAYVASHDLQEPLRKIEAFGDSLLQRSPNLDVRQRDQLERMRTSAHRMREMVDGLLQLSRLTMQAQPFERVDLSRIIMEVLSDLELSIQQAGALVEVSDLPIIEGDPL